ncbi:hypothetical protein [Hoeflea ulvae]|uniref:MFS transporter n=1 Tax=Hoeflea ulvae TaxID=2983764 RepID=A0ABT3YLV4_9HYPH|nr:hypothetical protein [Hoeflea ulvae]MCY0096861.1 hypothetical protein [Hoeflea ulvae]
MTKASLPLLLILVLFGNGLRSVVSSTVFVSEGVFASFLRISVTQTSAVIELLLGAVLVALLVAPRLIARFPPRQLAGVMCLVAGMASLGLALVFWLSPPLAARAASVFLLFPLLGFSLATLAPLAQLMTGWGGEKHTKLLTGTWAVAMPMAFLVTPQLVRVVAPRYGLEVFFTGFAGVVFLLIAGLMLVKPPAAGVEADLKRRPAAGGSLVPVLAALVSFEAATMLMTLAGITSLYTLIAGVVFILALGYFLVTMRRQSSVNAGSNKVQDAGVLGIFAFMFLVNAATTGFYDTAYLFAHLCSNTLIADRATLGALAQVVAAMGATAILARFDLQQALMLAGAFITVIGLGSFLLYQSYPYSELFIGSKMVVSFGSGLLITAAIFACSNSGSKSASLAFFIAFVIVIGTEVGLEGFEIMTTVMELVDVTSERIYSTIFLLQCLLVLAAMPFVFMKSSARLEPDAERGSPA